MREDFLFEGEAVLLALRFGILLGAFRKMEKRFYIGSRLGNWLFFLNKPMIINAAPIIVKIGIMNK